MKIFQIIEDFQQKALQQGSEDPQSAETLQKCEEYLPGQVRVVDYPQSNSTKTHSHSGS